MPGSALLLLLSCAGPDGDLNKVDVAPGVSFVNPVEGARLAEGEPLTFVAAVEDDHDALEELDYAWTLADGSSLVGRQELLSGQVRLTVDEGLPDGAYVLTLTVSDAAFNIGADDVAFTIADNAAPTLTFLSPTEGGVYSDADDLAVDLAVVDADEDDVNVITLAWSGDLVPGAPTNPTSDGHARFTVPSPAPGDHLLAVLATDPQGSTAYAELHITVVLADTDGDGHVADVFGGDDCDDADATIHPGAEERCDTVDEDCDGVADDDATDATALHPDTDDDGYGDAALTLWSCGPVDGYVTDDRDCDDVSAEVHPGVAEQCDGVDEDCDGSVDEDAPDMPPWYDDLDADGHGDPENETFACTAPVGTVSAPTDCDDTDPDVHPGADEVCNEVDDDCDGEVDEAAVDAPTWYTDSDGDDHGAAAVAACSQPDGTVAVGDDCDDADPLTWPGATELCDGIDNDCDGTIDEGTNPADGRTWYRDADGDGHGTDAETTVDCSAPAGFVGTDDDCDDGETGVHPGADEHCDDVDEDCDGTADDSAVDAPSWFPDADGDHYGDDANPVAACAPPAGTLSVGGDCDDAAADVHPGVDEVCNGEDDDCDGTADDAAVDALSWYADTDVDGWGDAGTSVLSCEAPAGFVADDDDCDDADNTVSPSAVELCNDVDDDCDGTIDESSADDAPTWYADDDGDGYGSPVDTTTACEVPTGYVDDATDCDDSTKAVSPAKGEVCDDLDVDEDCDGLADDEDPSVKGTTTWYLDGDEDGYGTRAGDTAACDDPVGYAATDIDCDDDDPDVNPFAQETCNSRDDDCDLLVDDADPSLGGTTAWYLDADGDHYGDIDVVELSCIAPAGYVADNTDCDDTQGGAHPGVRETCDTEYDDDCDGDLNDEGAVHCADFYVDADGDGYGDPMEKACLCVESEEYPSDVDTDCDDGDVLINPVAWDTCGDGVDQDCDGADTVCAVR